MARTQILWLLLLAGLTACDKGPSTPTGGDDSPPVDESKQPETNPGEESGEPGVALEEPGAVEEPGPGSDASEPGTFSIEILVPPEHRFSDAQLALINEVAKRWEAVIVGDIPDSDYTQITFDTAREGDYDWGTARGGRILIDRVIDDVAIIVTSDPELTGGAWGGLVQWTAANNLPAISHIILAEELLSDSADVLKRVLMHEMCHALGFGTSWTEELLKEPDGDAHFAGPLAIEAFDAAGGGSYDGQEGAGHRQRPLAGGGLRQRGDECQRGHGPPGAPERHHGPGHGRPRIPGRCVPGRSLLPA